MLIILLLVLFFGGFIYIDNHTLSVTHITLETEKIEEQIKIVHLSDLHNDTFGKDNQRLIEKVKDQNPDIIVFTGDLVTRSDTKYDTMVETLSGLGQIKPVYYVAGNHEHDFIYESALYAELKRQGIKVLNNETDRITVKNTTLSIQGLDLFEMEQGKAEKILTSFEKEPYYKLVLSHYPENFDDLYSNYTVDLVMSGHAHGGQIILPFFGGVYSPGQGLHPKYYGGLYKKNSVNMVVSRGLGNSLIIPRVFNPPDIVVISLKKK